ncbi:hypothetical protein HCN44_010323 [Aphidius gifuensis]|uniref:Tyrosine-protein phosphatase domain-containing protein n=1 Tax=Aphidius gifuensis TaxID=684658 RepID=A0A834XWD8_APHGI|nr:hypothetical protein HCN44_010323 [Aphidius gifuensis]
MQVMIMQQIIIHNDNNSNKVIASLSNESSEQDNIYWSTNIDVPMIIGGFTLILKNLTKHTTYIQSIINIIDNKKVIEKTVVHMQIISWPINNLPSSPGAILTFATDIMSEQSLGHCSNPIVVHCKIGGSLSSLFLLATTTICPSNNPSDEQQNDKQHFRKPRKKRCLASTEIDWSVNIKILKPFFTTDAYRAIAKKLIEFKEKKLLTCAGHIGDCKDNDKLMIYCDGCLLWYHQDYVGFVESINSSEDWFCNKCHEKSSDKITDETI